MIKLSNITDKLIVDMFVKAMLDPSNKYFYIPNLTLEKVEELCANNDIKTETFWKCFNIALPQYKENKIITVNTTEVRHTCPECNCPGYVSGCSCPNCDYVE